VVTRAAVLILALSCIVGAPVRAHAGQTTPTPPRSGKEIYDASCAACHGADGRGNPQAIVGFEKPLPDFTDCLFATVEAQEGWHAVVHEGGPVRALDHHMPAFGAVLSDEEIDLAVAHVRTFCTDHAKWPQGDLNFPRALITEKAFPENEALWTTTIGRGAEKTISNTALYERRLTARTMFEVNVPFDAARTTEGQWTHGLGDVAVAVKHALWFSLDTGSIVSVIEELGLPTGKESLGLGSGTMTYETSVAAGQRITPTSFVQFHGGIGLPANTTLAPKEAFWRTAIGKTFTEDEYNRTWTPMVEVVAAREIVPGAHNEWDVVPQMEVSLSKRRHILVSGGLQIPVNARGERHAQVLTFFLWDWYEGGLLDGWR
jgi:mono/diheme cytochrome c family protein